MSGVSPLPWQTTLWQTVTTARAQGRLHHAWLLSGPDGVGKRSFVRAWTAALLCEQLGAHGFGCGLCSSCRMLATGGHPDAHWLCTDGHLGWATDPAQEAGEGLSHWVPKSGSMRRDIAVDAARSLIDKLSVTAHRGGMRVAVVHPASDLSESAANALLKTIEEPPPNTLLVFITVFPQALKQTIRSRCQALRFATPGKGEALSWLYSQHPEADAVLLQEAGGAPLTAAQWLGSGEAARRRQWRQCLEQVAARRLDPLTAASELTRDKSGIADILRLWQRLLLERLHAGAAWGASHEQFLSQLVEGLRRLENQNANAQLLFESLLLRWRLLAA